MIGESYNNDLVCTILLAKQKIGRNYNGKQGKSWIDKSKWTKYNMQMNFLRDFILHVYGKSEFHQGAIFRDTEEGDDATPDPPPQPPPSRYVVGVSCLVGKIVISY